MRGSKAVELVSDLETSVTCTKRGGVGYAGGDGRVPRDRGDPGQAARYADQRAGAAGRSAAAPAGGGASPQGRSFRSVLVARFITAKTLTPKT